MRRLLAIAVMALTAAACGSAGESGTTEAVPDPTPDVVAAASAISPISLPEASGDPELDALGAELAGLEQELLALDAATPDLATPGGATPDGGTP